MTEYAFASIVQARPCPTFGRPVHLRGSPHRLRPGTSPHALRIPPRDGHPALRSLARKWLQVRLGCIRLSPSCPFRLLHTFLLRPARHYPRLWIRFPSSGNRRDLNPPDQCAAWRTLRDHPTPLVPLPCRSFVLHNYRSRFLAAEAERSPRVRTRNFTPTPSRIRATAQRISGFTTAGWLTNGSHALRRFAFARFGVAPTTSFGPPLAG